MVDTYPDSFGVRRPFKLENMNLSKSNSNSLTITQGNRKSNEKIYYINLKISPIKIELFEAQRTCECKSKQTEYFLFKKELAVPEYIIEYEYNYKV